MLIDIRKWSLILKYFLCDNNNIQETYSGFSQDSVSNI